MNTLAEMIKKSVLPVFALILTAVVILQVRGAQNGSLHTRALSALGVEKEASAAPAPAAPVAEDGGVVAEGRLVTYPGAEVAVGSEVPGTLVRLLVHEKDSVRKGQVIAELKADDVRAELSEARARVSEAEADIRFADVDLERAERLLTAKVGTQETADRARSHRDAAHARRQTALASVARLEAILAKTRITAPLSGVVITRSVDAGEHVEAGDALLTIADLDRTRIEAEVDEFDAGRVALGSRVTVTAEGYTGQSWKGTVEEIPDAVVGRRLKPQDPGRPSDTRVLLVKVALDEGTPLKLGQRVEVEIGPEKIAAK
ncbi:MAG TPA: efflux RND transporter periplasmic adaptor subunit [Thermoanaerobaculia bacterium]|nr:efflux RND transporter periplasmic adaptor subunit [Thermoanaerobaculia bacterium]